MRRESLSVLGVLAALSVALGSCTSVTPEVIVETVVVERTVQIEETVEVEVEATPSPAPELETPESKILVVCQKEEPDSLYVYDTTMPASMHIQQAVYDGATTGAMDILDFAYQPTILQKLPSLEDGDALINAVTVQGGDLVVNDADEPVELVEGTWIRPAGCRSADCAVEFTGEPLEMDQMVVTFELIEGITWSDGTPLTADDSVYGFELNADPQTPTSHFTVERTASYEATSDVHTVWTGLPGYIDILYYTNFWHPFPRALWQDELGHSAADLLEAEESARKPMGWGAFVITEWVAGDHITVEKNPNYFRADEGLPYIDTVIYRFVADPNAAIAQLISGECDIVTHDTALGEQAELLLRLEQESVVNPVFVADTIWEHLDFGINPVDDYDRPDFFEDVRVRQAIAMCVDRQSVVDTLLHGRSVVMDTYIPPEHPLYADGLTTWPYDPEAGRALLEEVGWVDNDGDGIREASAVEGIANGTPLEFRWHSLDLPWNAQYLQSFQQDLAECGVQVDLETVGSAEFFAEGPDGLLFGRRFDLASFAWLTPIEPPCELYLSSEIPSEENGWDGSNNPGFIDEAYDTACLEALGGLPGSEAYVEGHQASQRIFTEQLPVVPLFPRVKLAAIRPEVMGFVMNTTEVSEMWNIETLDLE